MATEESEKRGLGAMDALHVAAAYLAEAKILYTLERAVKPIHRTSLVRVVSIDPNNWRFLRRQHNVDVHGR